MQEVDKLQKILKMQQTTTKHRKTSYYDNTYDKTLLEDSYNQPKTLAKDRNMSNSTTSSSDEEDLTNKQKHHSSSDSTTSDLVK